MAIDYIVDGDRIEDVHGGAAPVGVPLIKECYANFECKVVDTRLVTKYNFFILEVKKRPTSPRRPNARAPSAIAATASSWSPVGQSISAQNSGQGCCELTPAFEYERASFLAERCMARVQRSPDPLWRIGRQTNV